MLAPVFFLCKPCRLVSACFHTQISQIAPQASGDLVHHRPLVKEMTLYLASPIFRSTSSSIYIGWQSDLTSLMTAVACRYTSIRQLKVHLLFHTRLPREKVSHSRPDHVLGLNEAQNPLLSMITV